MTTLGKVWTKDEIKVMLATNDVAVERAVVAIYNRQTRDEQNAEETKHKNGVGFSGCHGHMGSYYAQWVLVGKRLTGRHADKARKMALHYVGQLTDIANA